MPKRQKHKKVEIKSTEVALVEQRLEAKRKPVKGKRTLVLTEKVYEEFEVLCRSKGWYPSEVIDEFIALYVQSRA